MILDYRETQSVGFHRPAGDGGWGDGSSPYPAVCQYCQGVLVEVLDTRYWGRIRWEGGEDKAWRKVAVCPGCGWWLMKEQDTIETATIAYSEFTYFSILRSFEVASSEVPLNILRDYLRKHERQFYNVNPTKFEQLVGEIFRDFLHCDVTHVGRVGDGGIDLLVVDSDRPLPIQVKRRADGVKWEPVSTVREFLGAVLLQGFQRGAIVTTASRFSGPATTAAQVAQYRQLVDQFELFDMPRFLDIFKLVTPEAAPAWRARIPNVFLPFIDDPQLGEATRLKNAQIDREEFLHRDISVSAYLRWNSRMQLGEPGDALSDWLESEKEVMLRRSQWPRIEPYWLDLK